MDEFLRYLFDKLDREAEEHYYEKLDEIEREGKADMFDFDPYDPYTPAPMAA